MCGIFAYKGKQQAAPILVEGLRRLEYRGYDSAGIAVGNSVSRCVGTVSELEKHHLLPWEGTVGIGHTRWATHGAVTVENAHPHSDCTGRIHVVHNGVIRNHRELRSQLEAAGHTFTSETDSEVICHLLEFHPFEKVVSILEGDFAFVAMIDGKLHAVSHGLPLHERIVDGDLYIASDVAAIPPYSADDSHGPHAHWMLKEIYDQAVRPMVGQRLPEASRYIFVGCGSSYHAALYAARLAREAGLQAEAHIASDWKPEGFSLLGLTLHPTDLMIGITQSGETFDVLAVLRTARHWGVRIAVITNTPGSTATTLTDDVIYMDAGREVAVAATKTFTSSLGIFQALFYEYDRKPIDIESIMAQAPALDEVLDKSTVGVMVIGKGSSLPVAMEGALKIREVAYLQAWAVPAGELKHGALALITPGYPVIAVGDCDTAKAEVEARGGRIITVNTGDDIADAIMLQCIAYKTAVSLGIDPDRPRNLAKSVTVE
jgi:glucosamine--fructose-6-phosphate aminotransferase (isomerizing)